jgi:hypothetical protein
MYPFNDLGSHLQNLTPPCTLVQYCCNDSSGICAVIFCDVSLHFHTKSLMLELSRIQTNHYCSNMAALLQGQLHEQLVERLPLLPFDACPELLLHNKEPTC